MQAQPMSQELARFFKAYIMHAPWHRSWDLDKGVGSPVAQRKHCRHAWHDPAGSRRSGRGMR